MLSLTRKDLRTYETQLKTMEYNDIVSETSIQNYKIEIDALQSEILNIEMSV
jgi:DNA repair protein RAD50